MSRRSLIGAIVVGAAGAHSLARAAAAAKPIRYQPTWDSLRQHRTPDWFRDAKFGIYFHWGPYSVPAFENEWYSRNMYIEGSNAYKHHLATYGHPSKFGYKDFIPLFTAAKFSADHWADLFHEAGARFAGPVAEHADGFAMWNSSVTKWNAARMGPKRDVVGQMAAAVRRRGMKLVTTFHHSWNYAWYPTWDTRYDVSDPRYSGLYGPPVPRGVDAATNPQPAPLSFCGIWQRKVQEVIDRYRPDLIYFDSHLTVIEEAHRRSLLAYCYSKADEWGHPVVVTYKDADLPEGVAVLDLERGHVENLTPQPWMTDTSIDRNSWCHVANADYRSATWLVHTLIDVVSKNGCLLLDVAPTAEGEIPEAQVERLMSMGRWLKLNGEAIYGTRPWRLYGEGPTRAGGGAFTEEQTREFTPQDIRFTTKGHALYAIVLGWPRTRLAIRSLGQATAQAEERVMDVRLLGHRTPLTFHQEADALLVDMPAQPPCEHAYVLRVTMER